MQICTPRCVHPLGCKFASQDVCTLKGANLHPKMCALRKLKVTNRVFVFPRYFISERWNTEIKRRLSAITHTWNDVFPRYRISEWRLFKMSSRGKMSFPDNISRKDVLPRHDVTESHLAQIWYHGKTSYQNMIIKERRLIKIWYRRKTAYQDMISRQDVLPR